MGEISVCWSYRGSWERKYRGRIQSETELEGLPEEEVRDSFITLKLDGF